MQSETSTKLRKLAAKHKPDPKLDWPGAVKIRGIAWHYVNNRLLPARPGNSTDILIYRVHWITVQVVRNFDHLPPIEIAEIVAPLFGLTPAECEPDAIKTLRRRHTQRRNRRNYAGEGLHPMRRHLQEVIRHVLATERDPALAASQASYLRGLI